MSPTDDTSDSLPRRSFLRIAGLTGAGWIVGTAGLTLAEGLAGKLFMPVNDRLDALLLNPQKLIPEFPVSAIEPAALIENTFRFVPRIDPGVFRLTVDGAVNKPLSLDLTTLQQMPLTSMVVRHVCVEGWAAIVQWGGIRLSDLIALAQPKADVRYVYFQSADGYYESWDLASVLHPQTMLAYQMNGAPLPAKNGAPLRLASPLKLGYKLSKWVTGITLVSELSQQRGYWEDLGYEWFAGL
ncbi:molybdopterin-dependent oxidoreductase [Phormidium sp. FACHB-592]|uniref:Molybdopterin-dependent oxidoreductase n=1 Tax=Stenomitos frigidus AS-A4 TaxID=2933935 RepID=A0ABV0KQ82_9CYAN|nr:molybdopterin-dependent oxidoreductase [Phormidium sp. FACHB-592]MBD2074173.1 molybdopterin-dependent oxidoreductase [Phormidium sp. FACHB-592]